LSRHQKRYASSGSSVCGCVPTIRMLSKSQVILNNTKNKGNVLRHSRIWSSGAQGMGIAIRIQQASTVRTPPMPAPRRPQPPDMWRRIVDLNAPVPTNVCSSARRVSTSKGEGHVTPGRHAQPGHPTISTGRHT
jgi:hypothetical protein